MNSVGPGPQAGGSSRFRAKTFLSSERYVMLDRRQSYYDCTQHDYKRFDFEGRIVSAAGGIMATQPMLSSEKFSAYIPLRARRPSSPIRLPRVIVNAFTNLVFGEGRFPTFRVEGDDETQDYLATMVRAMSLPVKMIRARNLGGAMGSVGLSWAFVEGKPRCEVHNSKFCYVHEWRDREQLIPEHVTELYQYPVDEWDVDKQKFLRNMYWYRRDWTPNADIAFLPCKDVPGQEPVFIPDPEKSEEHQDGINHFVWIQNLPSEDVDGLPDYEGLYEPFDTLDLIASVVARGATLNLDPTLKLKMDPSIVNEMGVKKGSDNALITGETGDAEYLELGGESIKAGIELIEAKRRSILEAAQCVIPNPEEISANGTSSVAMKMLYAPSIGVGDVLREQYGRGMVRMLEGMHQVAKAAQDPITIYGEDGEPQEIQRVISLPPRVQRLPPPAPKPPAPPGSEPDDEQQNPEEQDDQGEHQENQEQQHDETKDDEGQQMPGQPQYQKVERTPGEGGEIEPQWGPYFLPTPTDQQNVVTTLSTATGNQPFMSTQTATEIAMQVFGRQPNEELQRVATETAQNKADQAMQMQNSIGGQVGGKNQLPPGAKPKPGGGGGKPGGGGGGKPPSMGGGGQGPDGQEKQDPSAEL